MKSATARTAKPATAPKRRRATALKGNVTQSFASQVAGFIKRYRPALDALAKQ